MNLMLIFVLLSAMTIGVVLLLSRPPATKKAVKIRLAMIGERIQQDPGGIRLSERQGTTWSDRVTDFLQRYSFGLALDRLIVHAGSQATSGQIALIGVAVAAPLGLIAQQIKGFLPLSLLAAAVGLASPILFLMWKRSSRVKKFNDALPDAIELMARALRAGHSVSSSVEMIAQQSQEPLAGEFASCFQQQKFGIPFRDAMLSMGERVPDPDLQFFITAVLVQKETGGDLTEILDRTTKLIRDRVRIKGEIQSYTAQGRLTGWILSALPLILLVIMNLISPGYSDALFTDPIGKLLLMAGGVAIVIGGFIISKIVDIKV